MPDRSKAQERPAMKDKETATGLWLQKLSSAAFANTHAMLPFKHTSHLDLRNQDTDDYPRTRNATAATSGQLQYHTAVGPCGA